MSVHLNTRQFKLEGNCNRCGAALYDIWIETGEALCSNDECEVTERFDPAQFANAEPEILTANA